MSMLLPVFTVAPSSKPSNKSSQESKRLKKMNNQTVSQRFRSVRCFVREIFEEMFYSNPRGFVLKRHVCVSLRGVNIAAEGLQKHMSSSFAIESLSSSSEGSQKSIWVLILIQGLFRLRNLRFIAFKSNYASIRSVNNRFLAKISVSEFLRNENYCT